MTQRHDHVINVDEATPSEMGQGQLGHTQRRLGVPAKAVALGCSHYEIQPGKTGFPFHYHAAIEEALYIVEGTGSLRIGKDTVAVRAGDYVTFPPGPELAHALTNDGTQTLRYLAMSSPATPHTLDICGYPDSGKFAFYAASKPNSRDSAWVMKIVKDEPSLGYYEDEPLAQK